MGSSSSSVVGQQSVDHVGSSYVVAIDTVVSQWSVVTMQNNVPDTDMLRDDDLDETTLDMGVQSACGSASQVTTASIISLNDGLPQGEPLFQRQLNDDLDTFATVMDQLTIGRSVAASWQMRLLFDKPSGS